MGAMPRLQKKDELNYRKGSTNESNNCRYCTRFIPDFEIHGIGGDSSAIRIEGRCRIFGLQEGRRYNVRPDYTCDAQEFDNAKKDW